MGKFTLTHRFKKHKYIYTVTGFTGEHEAANGNYWKLETIPENINPVINSENYYPIYTNGTYYIASIASNFNSYTIISSLEDVEYSNLISTGSWDNPAWAVWEQCSIKYFIDENNDYYSINGAGKYNGNYYFISDFDESDYPSIYNYMDDFYYIYTNGQEYLLVSKVSNQNMLLIGDDFQTELYGDGDDFIYFQCNNGVWSNKQASFESGYSTLILELHTGSNPNGSPGNNTNQQEPSIPRPNLGTVPGY
jgi:hypothetical protein